MASGQGLRNPESDSFAYMETLLESLAVLGKLGSALDIVGQRLPGEIFSLVETTLAEVGERAEYGRRGSMFTALSGTGALKFDAIFVFPSGDTTGSVGMSSSIAAKGGFLSASNLRLAALESSSKRVDHETLKDFFWTVYTKLDAVTQGLRVVYEVSNRIGSVCTRYPSLNDLSSLLKYFTFPQRWDFKDSSGAKPGALFPLTEMWMPLQAEVILTSFLGHVLTTIYQVGVLLQDYLTDEEQGSVSGRNPISSINEILREGKYSRDKAKVSATFFCHFADIYLVSSTSSVLQTQT
jgi:exocyst complex component 4